MTRTGKRLKALEEAAELLELPVEAVRALAAAGYLSESADQANPDTSEPAFAVSDLKGFLARNTDGGLVEIWAGGDDAPDPQALLDALDARSGEMGRKALEIFRASAPEASIWTAEEQARFAEQATRRFEAILAVTGAGEEVDDSLVEDLHEVGASAAWAGSPLPEILVVLRISRDLVVQTAVEVAEEGGRQWGLALSLLLTRVLPAMDRLTDALAQGYWSAVVGREESNRARYEHMVEQSSDGIYELDVTGRLSYANPSLAAIVGQEVFDLEGALLDDVFHVVGEGPEGKVVLDRLCAGGEIVEDFSVVRPDGVRRELHVVTFPRREHGEVVGYQGVVTDLTAGREADRAKAEFLSLVTQDLRSPITTILGLGVTLEAYADELPPERVRRTGASVRRQAERVSRLVDDLYEVSRLQTSTLRLNLRATSVEAAAEAALASLPDAAEVDLQIEDGLEALADARRLEQVLANLVENALGGGAPEGAAPVVLSGRRTGDGIELLVVDSGPGIPDALVPTLFTRLGGSSPTEAGEGAGRAGLFLVRGLVEAMGGRVTYEAGPVESGAAFRVWLMRPPRR